jgi:hypothetical protein
MTQRHGEDGLTCSVCNPDLGWEPGKQFDFRNKDGYQPPAEPVPMPVTVTLRGKWELAAPYDEVLVAETGANATVIAVAASDARSMEFQLDRIP